MSKTNLTGKIERLDAFEEKHGIRIENISVWFEEYDGVSVLFELHPLTGTTIPQNMKVVIAVYNKDGQIIVVEEELFLANKFWGFAMGNRRLREISPKDISKIRIYPILW